MERVDVGLGVMDGLDPDVSVPVGVFVRVEVMERVDVGLGVRVGEFVGVADGVLLGVGWMHDRSVMEPSEPAEPLVLPPPTKDVELTLAVAMTYDEPPPPAPRLPPDAK